MAPPFLLFAGTAAARRCLQTAGAELIVCWNCLFLNQQLFQAPATERQALADAIARMSPVSWQHINLQGEFDFSDEALTEALQFDLGALLTVEWETDDLTQPI